MITARADVVGSLLRPPALLDARRLLAAGEIEPAAFKRIEDRAVDEALALQVQAGMQVVTDGEMRRESFQSQMTEAVDGFGAYDIDAFLWGEWHGTGAVGDKATARPAGLGVVAPLRRKRHLSVEEWVYMRARTDRTVKVTIPSPSLWANFWSPERSKEAYPTLDQFLEDVARILREEVEELVRLGATYINSMPPTTLCCSIRRRARSTSSRDGTSTGGWRAASSWTTTCSGTTRGHVRVPPLPGQPGQPVAHVRLVQSDRTAGLRRRPRPAPDAGVRR